MDGCWVVDESKTSSGCQRCASEISPGQIRFQWCPDGKVGKGQDRAFYHAICAVKPGSQAKAKVDQATVRKSLGLSKNNLAIFQSLMKAAQNEQVQILEGGKKDQGAQTTQPGSQTNKKRKASEAQKSEEQEEPEPPTKKGRGAAKAEPKAKAKAKAKARADKEEVQASPKAKARGKADAKAKAKAKAQTQLRGKQGNTKSKGVDSAKAKEFEAHRSKFSSWTGKELEALLKANDQSRSGNKACLVAKCADGATYGKLPRCPTCFGGKIKFRLPGPDGELTSVFRLYGGAYGEDKITDQKEDELKEKKRYYCTGYFDDDQKVECDWQADEVERDTWVETN